MQLVMFSLHGNGCNDLTYLYRTKIRTVDCNIMQEIAVKNFSFFIFYWSIIKFTEVILPGFWPILYEFGQFDVWKFAEGLLLLFYLLIWLLTYFPLTYRFLNLYTNIMLAAIYPFWAKYQDFLNYQSWL